MAASGRPDARRHRHHARRHAEQRDDAGQRVERGAVRAGRIDAERQQQRTDRRGEDRHRLRGALDASELRRAVGAAPEAEEHHHHEAAADAHRDRLHHHVRDRRDVREADQARAQDRPARPAAPMRSEPRSANAPAAKLPSQAGDGRDGERGVVDVRREAALGEDRFVEEADARRDQAVGGAGQRDNPERRRAQRRPERRPTPPTSRVRRRAVRGSPSTSSPIASGDDRSSSQASGARPTSSATPMPAHADAPAARRDDRADRGKRQHEADAHRPARRSAIACVSRRRNHLPTIARLTIDSALWPTPRVSVISDKQRRDTRHLAHRQRRRRRAPRQRWSARCGCRSDPSIGRCRSRTSAPSSVATRLICA